MSETHGWWEGGEWRRENTWGGGEVESECGVGPVQREKWRGKIRSGKERWHLEQTILERCEEDESGLPEAAEDGEWEE